METNLNKKLMLLIAKMEPIEFCGLATFLGVKITEEVETESTDIKDKYKPRDFTDVLADVMQKFDALNRQKKRELFKLVKKSVSTRRRDDINAGNTENTKTTNGD